MKSVYAFQEIESEKWDMFVSKHPSGFHEQTSIYATMRSRNNYRFARVGITSKNGDLLGGAQLLYRNIFPVGKLAFITQGPLVLQDRVDIAEELVKALDSFALKIGIIRLRIINYSKDDFWERILCKTAFERSGRKWTPLGTVLVPCDKTDDEIFAGMKPKCRYNIRIALRNNLIVRIDEQNDLNIFYELLSNTAQRQNFPIFPFDYYKQIWQLFASTNNLHLITVSVKEETLAALVIYFMGNKAYYLWGGISTNHPNLMANYMAHWEAIRVARSHGCKYYDFCGGATGRDDGVAQFKRKWSSMETNYPDPFDKYYGRLRNIYKQGTQFLWDHHYLRRIVDKLDYRLRKGRMPF